MSTQPKTSGADRAPIRVGDRFRCKSGRVWKCIESKPFGVRDFMAEDRALFMSTTTTQMRLASEAGIGMQRVS